MPNRDGTGPNGEGSKTGRQLGNCEGANPSTVENRPRLGLGRRPRREDYPRRGRGLGRGFRRA
jgi:hypothetical protein